MSNAACTHLDQITVRELPPSATGCEDCLRTGGKWFHLRIWSWCYIDEVAFGISS